MPKTATRTTAIVMPITTTGDDDDDFWSAGLVGSAGLTPETKKELNWTSLTYPEGKFSKILDEQNPHLVYNLNLSYSILSFHCKSTFSFHLAFRRLNLASPCNLLMRYTPAPNGGSQLISTSILFHNDIPEPKLSVPNSLNTSVMWKGGFSGGIRLRQFASFSWITNVNVSGLMLVTR